MFVLHEGCFENESFCFSHDDSLPPCRSGETGMACLGDGRCGGGRKPKGGGGWDRDAGEGGQCGGCRGSHHAGGKHHGLRDVLHRGRGALHDLRCEEERGEDPLGVGRCSSQQGQYQLVLRARYSRTWGDQGGSGPRGGWTLLRFALGLRDDGLCHRSGARPAHPRWGREGLV